MHILALISLCVLLLSLLLVDSAIPKVKAKAKAKGRTGRGQTFSAIEIDSLLTLIESNLPLGQGLSILIITCTWN
jgi:hypothetical protein